MCGDRIFPWPNYWQDPAPHLDNRTHLSYEFHGSRGRANGLRHYLFRYIPRISYLASAPLQYCVTGILQCQYQGLLQEDLALHGAHVRDSAGGVHYHIVMGLGVWGDVVRNIQFNTKKCTNQVK